MKLGDRVLLGIARRLVAGRLELTLSDGSRQVLAGREPGPEAAMVLRKSRLARRLLIQGAPGFAAGYMAGEFDTPDLEALLRLAAVNEKPLREALSGRWHGRLLHQLRHALNRNTRAGSRRNIRAHYDLGNDFYKLWLDPGLTYSSAVFGEGQDLGAAQDNKYRLICEAAQVRPEASVLEIGCGWGGFASYAARERGARVTALTISQAQFEAASRRMQAEGLNERVAIVRQDYRDYRGRHDALASIEMFEAVGEAWWPAFFAKVKESLKPGARAGLQIITIADELFERYRRGVDFIQRYIFPGGLLPSPGRLHEETARAGLAWQGDRGYGQHYARTLRQWRERFLGAWDGVAAQGFDERFKRLWTYYLAYSEAGFRTGRIDVRQIALQA
jgi:cyclopropane-fatty-acyl-phospholipid synthase